MVDVSKWTLEDLQQNLDMCVSALETEELEGVENPALAILADAVAIELHNRETA